MKVERLKLIEKIYHQALEVAPAERVGFFNDVCGNDDELRREVESLLSFDDPAENFLDSTPGSFIAEMFSEQDNNRMIGRTINQYKIVSLIGEGGMGAVYLAQDTKLLRHVALKIFRSTDIDDQNRVKRFVHEARAASALNHPHIMTIYEIGKEVDLHFIAMEYVSGSTLHDLIHRQTTDLATLIKYLTQTAEGLHKAHEAGIVHRDLKPENVMISDDGYAKILDFGLAKLVEEKSELHKAREHLSMQGVIMGTLGYMSPEQAQSKAEVDQRSDIFSFGCILYEAVARRRPFYGDSPFDTLNRIVNLEPEPLLASSDLKHIVDRCLKKSADDRFRSMKDVLDLLAKIDIDSTETIRSESKADVVGSEYGQKTVSRAFSEQRRQTTTMSGDLSTFSELLDDLEPEESGEIMDELFAILDTTVAKANGRIEKRLNDMFTAAWGIGRISENDAENAIHAALDLQKDVNEFAGQLAVKNKITFAERSAFLKVGISTGTVLFGQSTDTGEFLTSGAPVNAARRLQQNAAAGTVLISHDTYRHVRGVFDVAEFTASGLSEKTKAYIVNSSRSRAFRLSNRGVEGIETRIVGRSGEIEKMFNALYTVVEDGELQAVSVVADAGFGKSRLLFEFRDRLNLSEQKVRLFSAVGSETKNRSPYSLIRELFSVRFEIRDDDTPHAAREKFVNGFIELGSSPEETRDIVEMKAHFLGHLIGFDFSESPHLTGVLRDLQQIYSRSLSYAVDLFTGASRDVPVLLSLDDLHWADDESLDLIEHLIRNCAAAKILVLEFARPSLFDHRPHWGEGRKDGIRLDLSPLSKRESRQLADDILQNIADETSRQRLRDTVVSNADGNPFYLEELVKMLIDRGAILTKGDVWSVNEMLLETTDVPTTLTGVLQARLDRLNTAEKLILQRASVIGREFWDKALAYIAPEAELDRALSSLRRKELLFRNETSAFSDTTQYLFKHAILHNVTYNTVLLADRRAWHQKTAEWLIAESGERATEYSATIAVHFENAKEFERSAVWFGEAGGRALSTNASKTAIGYFEKALSFSEKGDVSLSQNLLINWQKGIGRSYYFQADYLNAIDAMTRMCDLAELSGDRIILSDALAHLSIYKFETGALTESLEIIEKAVDAARDAGDSLDAQIKLVYALFRRSRTLVDLGRLPEAIATAEQGLAITEPLGDKALIEKGLLYHALSFANYTLGDLDRAEEFTHKELAIMRQVKNFRTTANALSSLGEFERTRGNFAASIKYYDEALAIVRESDLKAAELMFTVNRCGALVGLGEHEKAERTITPLVQKMRSTGHFMLAESLYTLAQANFGVGKMDEAKKHALETLDMSISSASAQITICAWRLLAKIAAATGRQITADGQKLTVDNCFDNAFAILDTGGLELEKAHTLRDRAAFELSRDQPQKAKDLDAAATEIFAKLKIDPV